MRNSKPTVRIPLPHTPVQPSDGTPVHLMFDDHDDDTAPMRIPFLETAFTDDVPTQPIAVITKDELEWSKVMKSARARPTVDFKTRKVI